VAPIIQPPTKKWQSLDEQYGLSNMFEELLTSVGSMLIEEEYAAHVSALLSPKGTAFLLHWQVSRLYF
jgi:hypothetical protein